MAQKQVDSVRRTFADPNIATFEGSSFKNAAARLGAGQARYPDTPVYQQDTGEFWALLPLHLCFLADGVTQATNRGTWGTLSAHWRPFAGTPGTPGTGSFAFQSADEDTLTVVIAKDSNSPDNIDEYYIYVEPSDPKYFFESETFERPYWE